MDNVESTPGCGALGPLAEVCSQHVAVTSYGRTVLWHAEPAEVGRRLWRVMPDSILAY